MRILLAEDDAKLAAAVKQVLVRNKHSVDVVRDGESALEFAGAYDYDLVILDLMMPRLSGFDVIRRLRGHKIAIPILVLTARDAVDDKIRGLDLGADDYMTKPFDIRELLARVRALLRRETAEKPLVLRAADLVLDPIRHEVRRAGRSITLTTREFALLEFFLRRKNRILTRDEIIEHVWDSDFDSLPNIVDVYVRYLRKKVDEGFPPRLIHTIRGMGYILKDADETETSEG